jgi:methionyl-tRNA formyltransferase
MKINCVIIGLTLCSCGGGSVSAGDIAVQTPTPIEFSSGTTVLSEDKIHVSVDRLMRTLAKPDWQSILAQHTGSEHAFIARRA